MSEGPVDRCLDCEVKGHVGLVYSPIDGGWVHPDIRDGNAFGRYEREQENAAYQRKMDREVAAENAMEARYS